MNNTASPNNRVHLTANPLRSLAASDPWRSGGAARRRNAEMSSAHRFALAARWFAPPEQIDGASNA